MIHTLAENVTASGAQPSVHTYRQEAIEGVYAVSLTSGTVVLQGRMTSTADWVDILSVTASDSKIVALFPEMRVNLTTGVGVSAFLSEATE